MNISWDRRSHNWDDEIILRTMLLGDDGDVLDMKRHVGQKRLRHIFQEKQSQLDKKSQVFWGHVLGIVPTQKPFTHEFYVSSTPSRHITI